MNGMKDVEFANTGQLTTEEIKNTVEQATNENVNQLIDAILEGGGRTITRGAAIYNRP